MQGQAHVHKRPRRRGHLTPFLVFARDRPAGAYPGHRSTTSEALERFQRAETSADNPHSISAAVVLPPRRAEAGNALLMASRVLPAMGDRLGEGVQLLLRCLVRLDPLCKNATGSKIDSAQLRCCWSSESLSHVAFLTNSIPRVQHWGSPERAPQLLGTTTLGVRPARPKPNEIVRTPFSVAGNESMIVPSADCICLPKARAPRYAQHDIFRMVAHPFIAAERPPACRAAGVAALDSDHAVSGRAFLRCLELFSSAHFSDSQRSSGGSCARYRLPPCIAEFPQ